MGKLIDRRGAIASIAASFVALCACGGLKLYGAESQSPQDDAPAVPPERIPGIDPKLCKACGRCASVCKRKGSAVKAVNDFKKCGYCVYCYGYFPEDPTVAPDARICPTGALTRRKLEEYRYEYTIKLDKCIACGACVRSCREHGNKSLRIAIQKSLCLGCEDCPVIAACPYGAVKRG